VKPKIVVVGSSNTDLVVKLPRIPKAGETIIGGTFSTAAGGKGANQAIAAARAGGEVTFITKVGNDHFGQQAINGFEKDELNIDYVGYERGVSSGIALIFVDDSGENSIGVASGANNELRPSDIERASEAITAADVLLVQLEIPLDTVEAAIRMAASAGVRVVLNPAPAQMLKHELCRMISVLTPNENEAEVLTGVRVIDDETIAKTAAILMARGIGAAVMTLGARGAYVAEGGKGEFIPTFKVTPVDSTAAGDVFNGALAVCLGERQSLRDAVRFANAAAAISVTRLGAQPSAPNRKEILDLL
jgi:ribokinase